MGCVFIECVRLASLCQPRGAHSGEPLTRANRMITHPLVVTSYTSGQPQVTRSTSRALGADLGADSGRPRKLNDAPIVDHQDFLVARGRVLPPCRDIVVVLYVFSFFLPKQFSMSLNIFKKRVIIGSNSAYYASLCDQECVFSPS